MVEVPKWVWVVKEVFPEESTCNLKERVAKPRAEAKPPEPQGRESVPRWCKDPRLNEVSVFQWKGSWVAEAPDCMKWGLRHPWSSARKPLKVRIRWWLDESHILKDQRLTWSEEQPELWKPHFKKIPMAEARGQEMQAWEFPQARLES